MKKKQTQQQECVFCGDAQVPKGKVLASGEFECSTCNQKLSLSHLAYRQKFVSEFLPILNVETSFESILSTTIGFIKKHLGVENCLFYKYDSSYSYLQLVDYAREKKKKDLLSKIRVSLEDAENPLFYSVLHREPVVVRHEDYIDRYFRFYKIFFKFNPIQFSYCVPAIFQDDLLGIFSFDFSDEEKLREFQTKQEIFNHILQAFTIAWYNHSLHSRYTVKYNQFQNLHNSGLTLNKLYLNNTQEIIRMTLLTMSGLTDTDMNLLIVYNQKYQALTVHKLWKDETNLELTQQNISLEEIPEFQDILTESEPKLFWRKEFSIASRFGFTGSQVLLLPGFELAGNKFSFILGRNSRHLFSQDEVDILFAYSDLVRITIDNSYLYHGIAKQERLEKEVEIATDIQLNLLPREIPTHPDYEFSGFMIPAREIGGDYYDFLQSPKGEETIVVIGDVSGKGIPAGMVMATARTIIHSIVRKKTALDDILSELNAYLYHNYKNSVIPRFMSMTLVCINHFTNSLDYRGGGHGNLLLYRESTNSVDSIFTGGVLLGIGPEIPLSKEEIKLEKGDSVLLFTDGATESQNRKGEMLEEIGLIESFQKNATKSPKEMLLAIYEDIKSFSGNTPQHDDITLVCIKRK